MHLKQRWALDKIQVEIEALWIVSIWVERFIAPVEKSRPCQCVHHKVNFLPISGNADASARVYKLFVELAYFRHFGNSV
jgi:hypothetical protein